MSENPYTQQFGFNYYRSKLNANILIGVTFSVFVLADLAGYLTLVLQVGGGVIYPPDTVFTPLHQNCLEFFGTLP